MVNRGTGNTAERKSPFIKRTTDNSARGAPSTSTVSGDKPVGNSARNKSGSIVYVTRAKSRNVVTTSISRVFGFGKMYSAKVRRLMEILLNIATRTGANLPATALRS